MTQVPKIFSVKIKRHVFLGAIVCAFLIFGGLQYYVDVNERPLPVEAADAPVVVSTSPINTETNVSTAGNITADFDQVMDAVSINNTSFILKKGVTALPGVVGYSGTMATFTPIDPLLPHITYTAIITTDAKSLSGLAMDANYSWTFTTDSIPTSMTYNGSMYSSIGEYYYGTGFESSEGFIAGNDTTSTGSLCGQVPATPGQNNWSGGNTGSSPIWCYNDFTTVNADGTAGNEKIMANGMSGYSAYAGSQFWRLARTSYGSQQSVPFGPNLAAAAGDPLRGAAFTTFKATIHLKPAVPHDGSILKIDTGNPSGGDRSNYLVYVYNTPTGLTMRGIQGSTTFTLVDLFTDIDPTVWHTLDMSLVYHGDPTYTQDWVTVTLDGTQTASYAPALNAWRADPDGCGGPGTCPYENHSRLQIKTGSLDADLSTSGFLIDDLHYSVDNSGNNTPGVPPPTTANITVTNTVVNDDGGTKTVSDFPLQVGAMSVTSGVAASVAPGTYTVSETIASGYTAGAWGGDCASDGSVVLVAGDEKVCTITNNDNPVPSVHIVGPTGSVSESGRTATLAFTLNSLPSAPVTIQLHPDVHLNPANPPSVTLDATNWNTGASSVVSAVDERRTGGGTTNSFVSFTVTSTDPNYNNIAVPGVTVPITDDSSVSKGAPSLPGFGTSLSYVNSETDKTQVESRTRSGAASSSGVPSSVVVPGGEGNTTSANNVLNPENTARCLTITKVIRPNAKNDSAQVKILQRFLKQYYPEVTVSGVYDKVSIAAVIKLQEKYAAQVLAPWGLKKGTGIVLKTTPKVINKMLCGR